MKAGLCCKKAANSKKKANSRCLKLFLLRIWIVDIEPEGQKIKHQGVGRVGRDPRVIFVDILYFSLVIGFLTEF